MNDEIVYQRFLSLAKCMTLDDVAIAVKLLADVSTNPYCNITPELNDAIDDAFDNWNEREDSSKTGVCEWKFRDKNKERLPEPNLSHYETSCDEYYDTTHDPEFKFCPFCGKRIKEVE